MDSGRSEAPTALAWPRPRRWSRASFLSWWRMRFSGHVPTREAMKTEQTKAIEVRNLDCGYGQKAVLLGLNFEVRPGEIFVIMGESGCGKSTLLKHLIGLNPPLSGEVVFQGRDFSSARGPEREEIQK